MASIQIVGFDDVERMSLNDRSIQLTLEQIGHQMVQWRKYDSKGFPGTRLSLDHI